MMRIALALAATSLLLTGCSSPEPAYYTLQPVPGAILAGPPTSIEIRRPGLAGYLDRSDIVLKSADYRLNVNSQLRWGEPLGDMIGRVLTQDLTQRLPSSTIFAQSGAISADPALRVEVDIQTFDEDAAGNLVLNADLAVELGRTHVPAATRHVSLSLPPAGSGAANQVAAMSSLLGSFADRIAEDVRKAGTGAAGAG